MSVSVLQINLTLTGWAHRHIFCAQKETLEQIVKIISEDQQLGNYRQPFMGMLEHFKANPLSEDERAKEQAKYAIERFGPSTMPLNEHGGS